MIEHFGRLGKVVVIVIIERITVYARECLGHWNLSCSRNRFIIIFLGDLITGCCRH